MYVTTATGKAIGITTARFPWTNTLLPGWTGHSLIRQKLARGKQLKAQGTNRLIGVTGLNSRTSPLLSVLPADIERKISVQPIGIIVRIAGAKWLKMVKKLLAERV